VVCHRRREPGKAPGRSEELARLGTVEFIRHGCKSDEATRHGCIERIEDDSVSSTVWSTMLGIADLLTACRIEQTQPERLEPQARHNLEPAPFWLAKHKYSHVARDKWGDRQYRLYSCSAIRSPYRGGTRQLKVAWWR